MGDLFYAQYTHDFQPSNKTAWGKCTSPSPQTPRKPF